MYRVALTIHIIGVAVFLGNITATLIWKMYSEKSKNPQIISHALSTAIRTDKTITVPGVLAITISGIVMLAVGKLSVLDNTWLLLSIALWLISAVLAIAVLVPSLKRLALMAGSAADGGELNEDYFNRSKRWNALSAALIVSPLIILVLMVWKAPA
jgi:uncharacterized membrane protein